ncbi:MAG TPA: glycosyltransferase [Verrucomicrobiae bacterium]|nr:glycosyltransferase [Verrucomicrobiae bacterium]
MWELRDLVPELQKIAAVSVLDLRDSLKDPVRTGTDRQAVASALECLAGNGGSPLPDLILFYARPALLSEEAFQHLRRRWKCPLFGMSLDDRFEFFPHGVFASGNDDYQHWAGHFDINLTNCLPATEWYQRRGLHCIYMPQGVRQLDALSSPTAADYKYEFSFVGSRKPERGTVIDQLLQAGIPIRLFGEGWPHSQWTDDPYSVYRSTQINLGIGFATPSSVITTVKNRDFECPGAGGCYLTTYNWELVKLFELGKEILCYRSVEELIEMYAYYRRRPEECLKIGQAAWRRCANEHTWEKRFRKVFLEAGFKLD